MTDLCLGCYQRPRPAESFLCRDCGDQWHGDLHALPGWIAELRVEAERRSVKRIGPSGRGETDPCPVAWAPSTLIDEIKVALVDAVHVVALGGDLPEDRLPALIGYLQAHEASLAFRSDAGRIVANLHSLIKRAERLCDGPAERRWYLGPCEGCGAPMRASRASGGYSCCGRTYDIATKLQEISDRLHDPDNRVTIAEAAALTGINRRTIAMRVRRGGIQPALRLPNGTAWFRLGDLVEGSA